MHHRAKIVIRFNKLGNAQSESSINHGNWQGEEGNVDQWIAACHSSNMSFEEFIKSDKSPEELAEIFLRCYERPENKIQPIRGEQAADWKEIFVIQKGETQCKI